MSTEIFEIPTILDKLNQMEIIIKEIKRENALTNVRGGKIRVINKHKKPQVKSEIKSISSSITGTKSINQWHAFYKSVKDLPFLKAYPKKKRQAIALLYQGLKKHELSLDDMIVFLEEAPMPYSDYMNFMKLDHISYIRKPKKSEKLKKSEISELKKSEKLKKSEISEVKGLTKFDSVSSSIELLSQDNDYTYSDLSCGQSDPSDQTNLK